MVLVGQAPSNPSLGASRVSEEEHETRIFVLDSEELEEAIQSALAEAGCTMDQLRQEARSGEFSSDLNWRTWFCVSGLIGDAI